MEIRYQGKARPHREIEAPVQKPPAAIRVGEPPPGRRSAWRPPTGTPGGRRVGRGRRCCGPLPPLGPKRSA
jgi:hypothetical protein